ncbi:hypothetical protein D3C78_1372780 [compost metagenome]
MRLLTPRAGRPQRLVAEIDQVATARQLEGEEQGRQGLQQGPYTHGNQKDENALTEQIRAYGEQGRTPAELQAVLYHQQHIGPRGQGRQQIGQQEQHPCIQVHDLSLVKSTSCSAPGAASSDDCHQDVAVFQVLNLSGSHGGKGGSGGFAARKNKKPSTKDGLSRLPALISGLSSAS